MTETQTSNMYYRLEHENVTSLYAAGKLRFKKVAINDDDVLPLKAAGRDATADLKSFLGPRDTSDLILMVSFTFAMRRHLILLAS